MVTICNYIIKQLSVSQLELSYKYWVAYWWCSILLYAKQDLNPLWGDSNIPCDNEGTPIYHVIITIVLITWLVTWLTWIYYDTWLCIIMDTTKLYHISLIITKSWQSVTLSLYHKRKCIVCLLLYMI